MSDDLARLSLNTATTKHWSLEDAVRGCVDRGLGAIGPWRDQIADYGLERAAGLFRTSGLRVSSLCRGGFITGTESAAREAALADNRRAIEEAACLGAEALVLVVGGLPQGSRELSGARHAVEDALADLAPHAEAHRVRLAIEPLHPMYCADRAVVSTLAQALSLAAPFPASTVGVVVDTFHVWWDPEVVGEIRRAGSAARIASYQVCDFLVPIPADALLGRGHLGDGVIDFTGLTRAVAETGYAGFVEVEIFNSDVWSAPGEQTMDTMVERYRKYVVDHL